MVVYYSHVNHKILKNRANDQIADEVEAKDTPRKTKNTIKEQRKIRNVLKNSYKDFVGYFDVNTKMSAMKNVFGF